MIDMTCEKIGRVDTDSCFECFNHAKKDSEFSKSIWEGEKFLTRAQCCESNIKKGSRSESYLRVKGYVETEVDEFLKSIKSIDEEIVFEVDGVIWVSVDELKKYVPAIKAFMVKLKKEGYERVGYGELSGIELGGNWYKRRIKKG